jgi:hypothetical protein
MGSKIMLLCHQTTRATQGQPHRIWPLTLTVRVLTAVSQLSALVCHDK